MNFDPWVTKASKFPIGKLVMTRGIQAQIIEKEAEYLHWIMSCIDRHAKGEWGDLDEEDKQENERALKQGGRLMSVYKDRGTIWIITEADRSATTILLPEEY